MTAELLLKPEDAARLSTLSHDAYRLVLTKLDIIARVKTAVASGQRVRDAWQSQVGTPVPGRKAATWGTIRNWCYAYDDRGLAGLLDGRGSNRKAELPPATVAWLRSYRESYGRHDATRAVVRAVQERARMWAMTGNPEFAIPGYSKPPTIHPKTDLPLGWSRASLEKHLGEDKTGLKFAFDGAVAVRRQLPGVPHTRVGLPVGAVLMIDDHQEDYLVRWTRGVPQLVQPIGLHLLDVASTAHVQWGFIPPRFKALEENDEGRKVRQGLTRLHTDWIYIAHFLSMGWRTDADGTHCIHEKGGACPTDFFRERIGLRSAGKVWFSASGLDSDPAYRGDVHIGPGGGNPHYKPLIEGGFRLYRIESSNIPGQTGANWTVRPEHATGIEAEAKRALKLQRKLPAELAAEVRHELLDWDQFSARANALIQRIDARTDHNIEGWAEAGHVGLRWRMSPESSEWLPEPGPDARPKLRELFEELRGDSRFVRPFRKSPRQVLEEGMRAGGFARLDEFDIPFLLDPQRHGVTATVGRDHRFSFAAKDLMGEGTRWESMAKIETPDGHDIILRPGTEAVVFVSPLVPGTAYVADLEGKTLGRMISEERVAYNDRERALEVHGKNRAFEALVTAGVQDRAAPLIGARIERRAHNDALALAAGLGEAQAKRKVSAKPARFAPQPNVERELEEAAADARYAADQRRLAALHQFTNS